MRTVSFFAVAALCLAGLNTSGNLAARASTGPFPTPDTLSGTYLMARTAALHHELDGAAQLYRESLRNDPGNRDLLSSAYFYTAAAGQMRKSFRLADMLLKAKSDQHVAHLSLAVQAMHDGEYARAVTEIEDSAGHSHMSYAGMLFEAWARAGMNDRAGAEKTLDTLAASDGAALTADFHRAMIADYLGDETAAAANYAKIAAEITSSPRLVDAYGRFLERHGRAAEAKALYENVSRNIAYRPVADAGLTRIAEGETPDAFIEKPADGGAEALLGVATALNQPQQADISLLFLRQVIYLKPDFPLADMLIASRYESVGLYEEAVKMYGRMDHDGPYARLAAIQNADDYLSMDQPKQAIRVLKQLIRRYPKDVDAWVSYGDTLRELEQYKDAVYAYSRAIACLGKPEARDWSIYFARANAAEAAGDWPAAEADLHAALKLNPDEPHILNFLGYSWVERHEDLQEAMKMLEKASALAPKNGFITDSVGWAYFRLGQYDKAAERLLTAVQQVPGDPTINDHLGDAYWMTGRQREARFQWNHALAFGATGAEKAKIEEKLKNGLNG